MLIAGEIRIYLALSFGPKVRRRHLTMSWNSLINNLRMPHGFDGTLNAEKQENSHILLLVFV